MVRRIGFLSLALLICAPLAHAGSADDREGLVTIISPTGFKPPQEIVIDPAATSASVHLEVMFGTMIGDIPADPNTFQPRFSGIKKNDLAALFTDIIDPNTGNVIGKEADVVVPFKSSKKKYTFKAKVKSVPIPVGSNGKLRGFPDVDKAKIQLRKNTAPQVSNLRVSGAVELPDGTWRVNPGQPVTLQANFSDPDGDLVTSYDVDFGDGELRNMTSAGGIGTLSETHTYAGGPSQLVVSVSASDGNLTGSNQLVVTFNQPPVAALRLLPFEGSFGYTMHVDAIDSTDPDGDPLSYEFDFGDGTPVQQSSAATADHVYIKPPGKTKETYTVTTTAIDSGGLSSSVQQDILIRSGLTNEPLLTILSPLKRETVQVADTLPVLVDVGRASSGALIDPNTLEATVNGVDVAQFYSFVTDPDRGDQIVSLQGDIPLSHVDVLGNNAVKVKIHSEPFVKVGQSNPITLVDTDISKYVRVNTNAQPIAAFSFLPGSPLENEVVTFDASASSDPEGAALSFDWNFGDGNTLQTNDPIATHTYTTEGIYPVSLTVSDGISDVSASPQNIAVVAEGPPGDPVLEVTPLTGIDFGTINTANPFDIFHQPSREVIVEVRNAGDGTLTFSSAAIDPAFPSPFSFTNGSNLPPLREGESYFIGIDFRPPAGPLNFSAATLNIESNAGNVSIPLSGVGIPGQMDFEDMLVMYRHESSKPSAAVIDFGPSFEPKSVQWNQLGNQANDEMVFSFPWPIARVIDIELAGADPNAFQIIPFDGVFALFAEQAFSNRNLPKVTVTFDPGVVSGTRRFTAKMVLKTGYSTPLPNPVFVLGEDIEVGLMGIASQLAIVNFDAPSMEFERVGRNTTSDQLGSAKDGLRPAGLKVTYLAGQETVSGQITITPIYPPGNTAFTAPIPNWQMDPNTLDPDNPTLFLPLEMRASESGHYSAVVTISANAAHIAPAKTLVHGYIKGDNSIGVFGTTESLHFVDEDNFTGFSNDENFSARFIGLAANGDISNNGKGFGDFGVLIDPFTVDSLEIETDQWSFERSDVVLVGESVYAIDSDVLEHTTCTSDLTTHACNRLASGGIGSGVIVENEDLLASIEETSGDVDLRYDDTGSLELDATPDGLLFFTESVDPSAAIIQTRLRWYDTNTFAKGVVDADLLGTLGIAPGSGTDIEELRVIQNGADYRAFVILDSGLAFEADINGTSRLVTATAALSPSGILDSSIVLDATGNWYSTETDGSSIDVCRESLHDGAASRACIGSTSLLISDAPLDVLLDKLGNVFVSTNRGVMKFAPAGGGTLDFEGYVLVGGSYSSDKLRGDSPDAGDKVADIDIDFERLWFSK